MDPSERKNWPFTSSVDSTMIDSKNDVLKLQYKQSLHYTSESTRVRTFDVKTKRSTDVGRDVRYLSQHNHVSVIMQ